MHSWPLTALILEHAPKVRFRAYGEYEIGENDMANAVHFGWAGLNNFDIDAEPATSIESQPILMNDSGGMNGRVHQINNLDGRPVPILDTKVFLIRDGQIVAETQADSLGVFSFSELELGNYGLVAVGSDGLGVIGVELIAASEGENSSIDRDVKLVSHRNTTLYASNAIDMALVSPESIGWINDFLRRQAAAVEPPPQSDELMPGQFDSFGGAGGGFGGGGDLFWIAGAAAIVAASNDDSNRGVVLPPPTDPPESPAQ